MLNTSGRTVWLRRSWMPASSVRMRSSCVTGCAICEASRGRWRWIWCCSCSATAVSSCRMPGKSKRPRGRGCPPETPPSPQLPSSIPPWPGNNLHNATSRRQQRQPRDWRVTSTKSGSGYDSALYQCMLIVDVYVDSLENVSETMVPFEHWKEVRIEDDEAIVVMYVYNTGFPHWVVILDPTRTFTYTWQHTAETMDATGTLFKFEYVDWCIVFIDLVSVIDQLWSVRLRRARLCMGAPCELESYAHEEDSYILPSLAWRHMESLSSILAISVWEESFGYREKPLTKGQ